ncbi:MerR family transcriptional regulator [Pelagibacterium limicola]|uniref:MerR family transcriptional regulator n=1 Tax=Pelagibacterium limicola TaxID=2791022 RepID=UPI0018AF6A13|nr:MerR family transcriptional regulator [Pelagibacterium limicola]
MDKSPDAFRTISEAADELDLPQHVLRFWETRFSQIKPLKRGGGRRYYRPDDVQLLKGIRHLLYDQGFTIKGVQRILKEQGARHVVAIGETGIIRPLGPRPDAEPEISVGGVEQIEFVDSDVIDDTVAVTPGLTVDQRDQLTQVLESLIECRDTLRRAREG